MSSELVSEDLLTQRARTIWSAADFLPIARSFAAGAQAFVARLALARGEPVLDVACGTGNLALPAARAGARVTGIDIAPNLIAHARAEALSAGLSIRYDLGDAEDLPYEEGEFDTTVSMFGMMFCYRPERATDELLRVTMPGGRIALATWTPEGFVGEMLRAHTAVVAPPPGVPSPLLWGVESVVQERFGARVRALDCTRRTLELRFALSPAQVTELFATCYGPTVAALKVAGREGAAELRASLTRLFSEHNSATDGGTVIVAEYLDVQARVA